MSEGKRPGGLTALAVLNFVFGGFNALGTLGLVAFVAMIDKVVDNNDQARADAARAWKELGAPMLYGMLVLMAVSAFLLIASGVGYLQQKRTLGRGLGNGYAIVSIASSLGWGLVVTQKAGGGFTIGTMVGLIYPVLTLILLNSTFKHDFVR